MGKKKKEEAKQQNEPEQSVPLVKTQKGPAEPTRASSVSSEVEKAPKESTRKANDKSTISMDKTISEEKSSRFDDDNGTKLTSATQETQQNQQPAIDFVLYLQQTGSIIALAKLMDALE